MRWGSIQFSEYKSLRISVKQQMTTAYSNYSNTIIPYTSGFHPIIIVSGQKYIQKYIKISENNSPHVILYDIRDLVSNKA